MGGDGCIAGEAQACEESEGWRGEINVAPEGVAGLSHAGLRNTDSPDRREIDMSLVSSPALSMESGASNVCDVVNKVRLRLISQGNCR